MDCSSWSLACNGLPPFLPGLAPNAGGPDDGGGGGGGPERVAGGGGGGGGGNGIAICTRAGKTDKKKAESGQSYGTTTTVGPPFAVGTDGAKARCGSVGPCV